MNKRLNHFVLALTAAILVGVSSAAAASGRSHSGVTIYFGSGGHYSFGYHSGHYGHHYRRHYYGRHYRPYYGYPGYRYGHPRLHYRYYGHHGRHHGHHRRHHGGHRKFGRGGQHRRQMLRRGHRRHR